MRRRLPAGLRWRLLLALVATSAVTLGVAALVVLPPLQDRCATRAPRACGTPCGNAAGVRGALARLDATKRGEPLSDYHSRSSSPCRRAATQTDARVLLVGDRALRPRPTSTPPGFVADTESSRRAVGG